jgi:hypothetical protein
MASAPPIASARPENECSHEIELVDLTPETPTCTIYGLAPGARGILEGPCKGSGRALARFGLQTTFSGFVVDGKYQLEHVFTEPVGDGCEWKFSERIGGSGKQLTFVYGEEITQTGPKCYHPCGALGTIEVR